MQEFERKLAEWKSIHDQLLALQRKVSASTGIIDAASMREHTDKIRELTIASEAALKVLRDCFERKRVRP